MKKFVYFFEPMGKNFFIKATDLKEAKTKLKKAFGEVPYYVGETSFKTTTTKVKQQSEFEFAY